jgi:ADP-ribose pyrophosphatase YjhB (NUDIX family)
LKRLYPKQPLIGVGAVLLRGGKILLEKRKNKPGKGKWSIPGGLIELGEKAEHTVVREVWEETGLKIGKPELIDVVDNVEMGYDGKVKYHFVIIDYFVQLEGGTLKASSDAAELKWVNLDDVESYELTATFREFFVRNRQRLKRFQSKR